MMDVCEPTTMHVYVDEIVLHAAEYRNELTFEGKVVGN